jgi:hypothetical protein
MDTERRVGKIVCVYHGYTITEALAEDGESLAGFRVFGHGATSERIYATPEEAMQVVDDLIPSR